MGFQNTLKTIFYISAHYKITIDLSLKRSSWNFILQMSFVKVWRNPWHNAKIGIYTNYEKDQNLQCWHFRFGEIWTWIR